MRRRVLVGLTLLTVATGWWFLSGAGPGFPLDDAWMHLVYARALAAGEGLAFNPGQPEAGVTAPLWTVLAALVEWVSTRVFGAVRSDAAMRALGGLFGLATAWVAFRLNSRAGRWPAPVAPALHQIEPLKQ